MFDKFAWLLLFLGAYATFCIVASVRSSEQNTTARSFFLPEGGISTLVFACALTVATFAGWTVTGQPGQLFLDGLQYGNASFVVITIPLASVLVLKRQWMLARRREYVTPGDMYRDYFGGDAISLIAAGIALLFAIPFLAALFGACGTLLEIVTDGLVVRDVGVWVLAVLVLLYGVIGGIHGVARVTVVQGALFLIGVTVIGFCAIGYAGGFAAFGRGLAKLASSPVGGVGMTKGFGGSDFNGLFATPGVIQFTAGLGREAPAGGPWTAIMCLSFALSLMGIQLSPAFSIMGFASRSPRAFPIHQIWGSALVVGIVMFLLLPMQGMGGLLLGASAAANDAGLALSRVLPVLGASQQGNLVVHYIDAIARHESWLAALLAVAAIAAMQATAAVFLGTAANIVARDVYARYFRPDADWERQRAFSRIAMLLTCIAALLMAVFGRQAVAVLGTLAIPSAFQLLPTLLAILWFPWITRRAATFGLVAGLVLVVLTEPLGQVITGYSLPWGRWPWTIHSGAWGMFANVIVCLTVCAFTRSDPDRSRRDEIHAYLDDGAWSRPRSDRLKSAAWILVLAWLFFAIGPGTVLGNRMFGAPNAGYEAWVFGVPSLWAWQVCWWLLGIGLIWFLAVRMGLSTLDGRGPDLAGIGMTHDSTGVST